MKPFKSYVVSQNENGEYVGEIKDASFGEDSKGEVIIKVKYSSLNYKDALSSTGNKGVTRNYPHTPGIDAAGIIESTEGSKFKVGDEVIVTGYDLGMNTKGGYGEYIKVPESWVVALPKNLTLKESMAYGTAGMTAGLSVDKIVKNVPVGKKIVVTGATGGVGSLSVAILSKLGYSVTCVTGKMEEEAMLKKLGAHTVISRETFMENSNKAMLRPVWDGGIDTVSGAMLTQIIKSLNYHGAVTCCGMVTSQSFESSIFPFILRGISLFGIDSVECDIAEKQYIWDKLSGEWKLDSLLDSVTEIELPQLNDYVKMILSGKHKGRTIVKIS